MKRLLIAVVLSFCPIILPYHFDVAEAAVACKSSPGHDSYHQYRIVDGRRCWYAGEARLPKSALAWKLETRRHSQTTVSLAMAAGEAPGPSTPAVNARASASASRRGEPAPDFDAAFAPWPQYAVARPIIHLLYPPRVSQAWGSKRVAVVVYRREP